MSVLVTLTAGAGKAQRPVPDTPRRDTTPQDTTAPAAAPPDTVFQGHSLPERLPQVRVSVLRTPFDVLVAPASVTAVSARVAAAARPGFALDEVLGTVAGVQVDNRLNFALGERIAIRGIGARSQFGVRGIRVIVDDIPATLPDGQTELNNVDLGSIGNAEVLRGPASALYGNASGGVVVLESASPPDEYFAPSMRILQGSDGLLRAQFGAGGTHEGAHSRTTYLLNAGRFDYHGFRVFSDARNAHVNTVTTYETDRAQLKAVLNAVQYDAHNPGGLSDSLLRIDRRQAFANNVLQHTGERGKQTQGGVSARLRLGAGDLCISGYALHRALDNPIPTSIIALHRDAGGARAAYAVTAGDADHHALSLTTIVGVESALQHDDRQNYANVHGIRGTRTLNELEHVTSTSPFVQLTATAGAAKLLGGLRYDQFRFAAMDRLINDSNPDDSGVRRMSAVSPQFGVSYALASTAALYANLATAFQTPTTTELANRPDGAGGFNPTLHPERTRSVEAGVHGGGGRATYHVALYHMHVRDVLIPFEVPSAPGRQFYRNAGAARYQGIEAELATTLRPGVTARVSYASTDARFLAYTVGTASFVGNRVPGVAPRLATFTLDAGQSNDRFIAIETRLQAATPVNDAGLAHSPGYGVVGVRGQLPVAPRLALIGGIANLFDATYNTSVIINAAGGRYFEPAAGRTAYAGAQLTPR